MGTGWFSARVGRVGSAICGIPLVCEQLWLDEFEDGGRLQVLDRVSTLQIGVSLLCHRRSYLIFVGVMSTLISITILFGFGPVCT